MVNSIDQLFEILDDQYDDSKLQKNPENPKNARKQHQPEPQSNKWSTQKIAQLLNIKSDEAEQLEGQLMVNIMNTKRFFTFDNQTIENLPAAVKKMAYVLRNGHEFNYTKMYNREVVTISFPMATGFPFVYTYKTPTLLKVGGEVRLRSTPDLAQGNDEEILLPKYANITAEFQMTYATTVNTKTGFITPFNSQRYVAGYNKKAQIHLPLRMAVDIDLRNNEITADVEPLRSKKNSQILHMSNWPYTSRQDILSWEHNYNLIHVRSQRNIEQTFGDRATGMVFQFQAQHEKDFVDFKTVMDKIKEQDFTAAILYPFNTKTPEFYNVNVHFDAERSTNKNAKITFSYTDDQEDVGPQPTNPKNPNERLNKLNAANPSSKSANSQKRQQEFLQNVAAGITHSEAQVWDFAIEFEGKNPSEYVLTIATADSPIDDRVRMLVFANAQPSKQSSQQMQVCITANGKFPNTPKLNFKHALEHDGTSNIDVILNFGEKCTQDAAQIQIKAKLRQTEERKAFLRQSDFGKQCVKQMDQGELLMPACRKATSGANTLDRYEIVIDYENVPSKFKDWTNKVYGFARYAGYEYYQENNMVNNKNGRIQIETQFAQKLDAFNFTIQSPNMEGEFRNVRLNKMAAKALVIKPQINWYDRLYNQAINYRDVCVLDNNQLNTFDNTTIEQHLGKCWHVMLHTVDRYDATESQSSEEDQDQQITVMARDSATDSNQKDVLIVVGQNNGHDYTVKLTPSQSTTSTPRVYITMLNNIQPKIMLSKFIPMMKPTNQLSVSLLYHPMKSSLKSVTRLSKLHTTVTPSNCKPILN